jgi:hypothetical protein
VTVPVVDLRFPHAWQAEVLAHRPLILPTRHYVYPRDAEEIERGALEVLIKPGAPGPSMGFKAVHAVRHRNRERLQPETQGVSGHDLSRAATASRDERALAPAGFSPTTPAPRSDQPFLATCALGFRDPSVPTGLWSVPNPEEICAVSGGYAYLIDTAAPERFTMIPYRPVLDVRSCVEEGLLLFVGNRTMLAWGRDGQAWESEKLSDEGVTITSVENGLLRGTGWTMRTDKETVFALDLRTGKPSKQQSL